MADATEYTITCTCDATNTKVRSDGTSVWIPYEVAADVGALSDDDRVIVLIRNPQKPLIVGIAVEA